MTALDGLKALTCAQARRALVAYAHGQLAPAARRRVERHVRACGDCRAALADEQRLAGELRREMPRIGQPSPGQMQALRALWPSIRAQIASSAPMSASEPGRDVMSAPRLNLNPLGGAALVGALMCAFLLSMMMYTPASAVGAPLPPVPADIQATPAPFTTAVAGEGHTMVALTAATTVTRTATLSPSLPNAPAAPDAGVLVRTLDAPYDTGR